MGKQVYQVYLVSLNLTVKQLHCIPSLAHQKMQMQIFYVKVLKSIEET